MKEEEEEEQEEEEEEWRRQSISNRISLSFYAWKGEESPNEKAAEKLESLLRFCASAKAAKKGTQRSPNPRGMGGSRGGRGKKGWSKWKSGRG